MLTALRALHARDAALFGLRQFASGMNGIKVECDAAGGVATLHELRVTGEGMGQPPVDGGVVVVRTLYTFTLC